MAQLRDIHMPEPGGFWPPAPGWWLLAILVLALAIWLGVVLWRRHQRNRWIRDARRELAGLKATAQADNKWFAELNALLKRCARERYPESQPHTLSGHQWADFMLRTQPSLDKAEVESLVNAAWSPAPQLPAETACRVAEQWLGGRR